MAAEGGVSAEDELDLLMQALAGLEALFPDTGHQFAGRCLIDCAAVCLDVDAVGCGEGFSDQVRAGVEQDGDVAC